MMKNIAPTIVHSTLAIITTLLCSFFCISCNRSLYASKQATEATLYPMKIYGLNTKLPQYVEIVMSDDDEKIVIRNPNTLLQQLDSALTTAHKVKNTKFNEGHVRMVFCINYTSQGKELIVTDSEYVQTMTLTYVGEESVYKIHHTYKMNYPLLRFFYLALPPGERNKYIPKAYLEYVRTGNSALLHNHR
jgi:hypothetical protein